VSIHWTDIDVVRTEPLLTGPVEVQAGQEAYYDWLQPLWRVIGADRKELPPVIVGEPATLTPDMASLGALVPGA